MDSIRKLTVVGIVVVSMVLGLAGAVLAHIGDISVGGVWVCRIPKGASGLSAEQRAALVNRRITEVLSPPGIRRGSLPVVIRPAGQSAAVVVAGITVFAVMPDDAEGTKVTTMEMARHWAGWLVEALRRALPGTTFRGL